MQFVILIPAYQPDDTLLQLLHDLQNLSPEQHYIIVDDGSTTEKSKEVFEKLTTFSSITLLSHGINQGKGAALKTGFKYFLEHFPTKTGIVTADADGQHLSADILNVGNALKHSRELVLGVRQFSESIPWRSRFGNELTRKVFSWFSGVYVNDTQTGLRAISTDVIRDVLALPEEGYAFEMDMLMLATTHKWTVKQVPIQTVYINQNRASHFSPLLDSLKIYFVFLRYSILSVLSAAIDFSLFFTGFYFSRSILASTLFARIISGIFNFFFCKKVIFKSTGHVRKEALQYLLLALTSLCLSFFLVSFFYHIATFNIFWSKLVGDSLIFLGNFLVQQFLIFKSRKSH